MMMLTPGPMLMSRLDGVACTDQPGFVIASLRSALDSCSYGLGFA
jgi:hypothetical protein